MKALLTINKPISDMNVVVRLPEKELKQYDVAVYIPDYIYITNCNFAVMIENVTPYVELN